MNLPVSLKILVEHIMTRKSEMSRVNCERFQEEVHIESGVLSKETLLKGFMFLPGFLKDHLEFFILSHRIQERILKHKGIIEKAPIDGPLQCSDTSVPIAQQSVIAGKMVPCFGVNDID